RRSSSGWRAASSRPRTASLQVRPTRRAAFLRNARRPARRVRRSSRRDYTRLTGTPSGACTLPLAFTRARRSFAADFRKNLRRGLGDLAHGLLEGERVGFRGSLRAPRHFPHILQRGGLDLFWRGRRLEVVEDADVAAHAFRVARPNGGVEASFAFPSPGRVRTAPAPGSRARACSWWSRQARARSRWWAASPPPRTTKGASRRGPQRGSSASWPTRSRA